MSTKNNTTEPKQSKRIQTSILNAAERKALIWLAERQPRWMTSNILSFIGLGGSLLIGIGYALTGKDIAFLWLASAGFVVNWYGDSLDGSLARVRNKQRPIYGYYLDHTLDCINECFMFIGAGLSPLMDMRVALLLLVAYLLLTVNVSVNAHLKKEFKLTYAGLGPTEFRIIVVIVNTLFFFIRPLREFAASVSLFGSQMELRALDIVGIAIFVILIVMYLVTVLKDLDGYAAIDPRK